MTSTASTDRGHPVTVAVTKIEELLEEVAEAPVWSMDQEETRATLPELARLKAQVAELELRVAAHADRNRVGDASGATSTAVWWANQTRQTRQATHREVRLARALDTDRHAPVRAALAAGRVVVEQAEVIIRAVDTLPDEVEETTRAQAVDLLLGYAADYDAAKLRILGRRIYQVIDPDAADAHEARLLDREEQEARAAASLTLSDDGHGKAHGRFTIPTRYAAMLRKALMAIAPKHRAALDGHAPMPGRPSRQRLGEAFLEYLERYPTDRLPKAGGMNATVVVTMPLDTLLGGLKAACLDTGEPISPSDARRMACEAGIIPAVLNGDSKVLDLGTTQRFHNRDQRIVFTIEQGGCTTQGCDWPPGMCHIHHPTPWSQGGATNRDGIMLCPRHHTLAHHPDYVMTHHPDGKVSFHRRI